MSETIPPLLFHWDGESMTPKNPSLADRYYTVGESYRLEVREERSAASHSHFFASVQEAWQNLPEGLATSWPSADHLRKFALIKAGYRDERSIVCASRAEAIRVGAFVKPMDEYAVVTVSESVVTVYTAKSQSMRAMGRERFQESKQAVLDVLAEMVGVRPEELRANAGQAA